jgi:DNA-repair protein XRCC2
MQGIGKTLIEPLDRSINQALPVSTSLDSTLNRGDLIEIQGPTGSGKTELLYFLTMRTVLPQEIRLFGHRPLVLGGRDKSVIVCDCDSKWDILRLHHIMIEFLRSKVREAFPVIDLDAEVVTSQLEQTTQVSLRRLHFFRPSSSAALAATLLHLQHYHFTKMQEEEICMLMIDGGLSSFFWQDRWHVESTSKVSREAATSPTAGVVRALQTFRSSHNPITFITNWAITPLSNSPFFFRQHIPPPYPAPFQVDRHGAPVPRVSPIQMTHHITLYNPNQSPNPDSEVTLGNEEIPAEESLQIYGIMRTPPRDIAEVIVTHFSFLLTDGGIVNVISPIDEELDLDRDYASQDEY